MIPTLSEWGIVLFILNQIRRSRCWCTGGVGVTLRPVVDAPRTLKTLRSDHTPGVTTGTATSNVVPTPWMLRTETEPPRSLQNRLTVDKPRPVPRGTS